MRCCSKVKKVENCIMNSSNSVTYFSGGLQIFDTKYFLYLVIDYEPADLTVYPPPRMIEGGFIFFAWVSSAIKFFPEKSECCRRYSHWNAPNRGFTS